MQVFIKKHFYLVLITALLLVVAVFFVLDLLGVQIYAVRAAALAAPIAILMLLLSIRNK